MDVTPPTPTEPLIGRTGQEVPDTTRDQLDEILHHAAEAGEQLRSWSRPRRAVLLTALAEALETDPDELIEVAQQETRLETPRLRNEITRTAFQLREFAAAILEGSYLEATIDHAAETAMGPRPDLRRMLVPLGVVAVYSASNFPFAFSVLGGDTASALAAGNAVVVKAHPGHPRTSQIVAARAAQVLDGLGAPPGSLGLVHGFDTGTDLVRHPLVDAAAFTGSVRGGQALARQAAMREDPIPFYGELGSLNPVLVTSHAVEEHAAKFGQGLAKSVLQSGGQLCTKPGLVLVPRGPGGDELIEHIADAIKRADAFPALTESMAGGYAEGAAARSEHSTVIGVGGTASPQQYQPRIVSVVAEDAVGEILSECFGPLAVVVRYSDEEEALSVIRRLEGSLTATFLTGESEDISTSRTYAALSKQVGRVLLNDYPTGVAVSWAQHHGGPSPATNSVHTSVGMTAMRRFLRPMTWQNAPQNLLPQELWDTNTKIPTRIDGQITMPLNR